MDVVCVCVFAFGWALFQTMPSDNDFRIFNQVNWLNIYQLKMHRSKMFDQCNTAAMLRFIKASSRYV